MSLDGYKYLLYEGLKHFNDLLNERNRTRMKFKGLLALDAATRTNWNDLIPAAVGDLYVLTGTDGDAVLIADIEYEVGDTIYVTNRVQLAGTDVAVNKISSGGKGVFKVNTFDGVSGKNGFVYYLTDHYKNATTNKLYNIGFYMYDKTASDFVAFATIDLKTIHIDDDEHFGTVLGGYYAGEETELTKTIKSIMTPTVTKIGLATDNGIMIETNGKIDEWFDISKRSVGDTTTDISFVFNDQKWLGTLTFNVYGTFDISPAFTYQGVTLNEIYFTADTTTRIPQFTIDNLDGATIDDSVVSSILKFLVYKKVKTLVGDPIYADNKLIAVDGTTIDIVDDDVNNSFFAKAVIDVSDVVTVDVTSVNFRPNSLYRVTGNVDETKNGIYIYYQYKWHKIHDLFAHQFLIVDELPDLNVSINVPDDDTFYWLKKDIMNPDGVTVKYHAGIYIYDKDITTPNFVHPYEDTDYDFEPSYDGTKYLPDTDPLHKDPTYSGDADKFVDSKFLYNTLDGVIHTLQEEIDDIVDITKTVHYTIVDDHAALKAIDVTTFEDNSMNIILVANDDEIDHYVDGTGTEISVETYDANPAAYATDMGLKAYYKYTAAFSDYEYSLVNDTTTKPQKTDVDFDSTIYGCACYDDDMHPVVERKIKFIGKLRFKLHIDDKPLDINKIITGEDGEHKGYIGSESKVASTSYLKDALEDYFRWIKPLHHVKYVTYGTKAELDAVDLSTLDDNKTYIITVTADETYPRGTTPETYDRTQYSVITVSTDADDKPVRALEFIGKIDDIPVHPYQIVEELPKAEEIVQSTTYQLTADQNDDDGNLAYTKGTYYFDKTTATFTDLNAKHMRMLGELLLKADTRTDWDDLVPCHVGDMWILTSDNEDDVVEIDDVEYKPGEFIVVTTAKLTGTGVEVERIASGSDAIIIVDELPEDGIKDTVFYSIPNAPGYQYSNVKWYIAKTGTDYTILSDGIHDTTGLVLSINDITSAADIATYCDEASAADAEASTKYIVNYTIVYDDSTTKTLWNTYAKAPYAPTSNEWTETFASKTYSLYVYDTLNALWDCIYPSLADSIVYVNDITTIPTPKTTVLYGVRGQSDIHYYTMPQALIDAGSTIDATGIHLVGAGVDLTYADVAANTSVLTMTYGFTEVTELTANENTVVTYSENDEVHACQFTTYVKHDTTDIYIYNGNTFEKIYPQDTIDNVIVHVQLTRLLYEKVVAGTSTLYTYDSNTIYDITDPLHEDAPKAYLRNINVFSNDAIIDVTILPSGTEDIAKVDRNVIYRIKNEVLRYSSISYYNLDAKYYITQTTGDNPHDVIAHLESGALVIDISVDQLRSDELAWATNVTKYGMVATTKAACTANAIVCYKDKEATDPSKYQTKAAASFDEELKVTQVELYFYSDERSEWICIYPSTVLFEDEDIDFYDEDVWHPIKP